MKVITYATAEANTQVIGLDEQADHDIYAEFEGVNNDMEGYVYICLQNDVIIHVEFHGTCSSIYCPAEYENYGGRNYQVWSESIEDKRWTIDNFKVIDAWQTIDGVDEDCATPVLSSKDNTEIKACIDQAITNHVEEVA